MYGACTLQDVSAVQGLPSGLLLKGLKGKKWKSLSGWSPIPTDLGLKWVNYYHYNYYCQVIPKCHDSCCCTGEKGFPRSKRSTYHRPSQVGGNCSKLERLIQREIKNLWLIWPQHQAHPYTPLKSVVRRSSQEVPIHGYGISLRFKKKYNNDIFDEVLPNTVTVFTMVVVIQFTKYLMAV